MCVTIPRSLPSKASAGEKRLWGLLVSRLSDDFTLLYEPSINSLNPDFILVGRDFGVLVIEVKGWIPSWIVKVDQNFFLIRQKDGTIQSQQSPLRQATGYRNAILDRLKQFDILTRSTGSYQGKLVFPIGIAALMSNITVTQAENMNIRVVLDPERILYRSDLDRLELVSDREFLQTLRELSKVQFSFPPLTDDQLVTIRGALHPEVVVKQVPASAKSITSEQLLLPTSSVLMCLDLEQERAAHLMGDGHRILAGVAGSGKTCILLARAKILANRPDTARILVICMNKPLAGNLRSILYSQHSPQYQEKITVCHFNGWSKLVLNRLPHPGQVPDGREYDEFLAELVVRRLQGGEKFDAILIDEAHVFHPSWFACCLAALKEDGDLLVATDANQRLYKRSGFTWKSLGIKAQGRTTRFDRNHRNTAEILAAAWSILPRDGQENDEDTTFPAIEPTVALRHGDKPTLYRCASADLQVVAIVRKVADAMARGYIPAEIAIIYGRLGAKDKEGLASLIDRLQGRQIPVYWVSENDLSKNYRAEIPGVRILTAQSALGLEFKVVIIIWLEQFDRCFGLDADLAALERRKLYVAMTRSQQELYLYGYSYSKIVHEIGKGNDLFLLDQSSSSSPSSSEGGCM
jgi:Nuclease-related domain/UvrD-like helicase C-terminal domain